MKNSNIPDNHFIEHVAQLFGQVFFSYDIDGSVFRYISPAFEKLCGAKPERVLSDPAAILKHVPEEDKEFLAHQYQKLLLTHKQMQVEFRVKTDDKESEQEFRWLCVSACVIRDEESGHYLIGGHATDMTDQKLFTQNIMKYNSKKNSTLEILSHDLAAPFANIQGTITAIEEQVNKGDLDIQQLITFIKQDAMRGSDMIRDFVDTEFLESSHVKLRKERVNIADRIAIMIDNYKDQEKLIAKSFELKAPEDPIFVYIDMMKFMQVMNNLVSNAIKFTKDNGHIYISVEQEEGHALVKVADNGIGIPQKMQPHLFDRFTIARRAGVRGEKSTGLGMSIIKTIVELHGGEITFESQEDVGTTFYIRIPLE